MRSHFLSALLLLLPAACGGPEANTKSQDPYERFLGEWELAEREDAAAMTEIVSMLEDPHFLVVVGAVEILGRRGRPEYLQHLLPKLQHPHSLVRQSACLSIGTIGNPEGVPALVKVLKDADPAVRRAALKGLGAYLDHKEALTAVVDAVADKEPSVSYMAHRILLQGTGKNVAERKREAWIEVLK